MEEKITVYVYIGFAMLVVLSIGAAFFYLLYGKKLIEKDAKFQVEIFKSITEAEEKQQEKLATSLHDHIIPILGAVEQSIDTNNEDYPSGKFDLKRAIRDREELEKIRLELRNISHNLLPTSLRSIGVIKALEHHVNLIAAGNSKTDFIDNSLLDKSNLPFSIQEQTHIYTICLELLNNLKKFAKFQYLKVAIEREDNYLIIDFMHDGIGITNDRIKSLTESSTGIGLKSISGRVLMLDATLNYSMDDHAANVTLTIPIKNENTN